MSCTCHERCDQFATLIHNIIILQAKGNAAFAAGDFQAAIEHFSKGIDVDSANHVLYSNRSAAQVHANAPVNKIWLSASLELERYHCIAFTHGNHGVSVYATAAGQSQELRRCPDGCKEGIHPLPPLLREQLASSKH